MIYGTQAFDTCSNVKRLLMPHATYRQLPTGGVIMPTPRFTIMMIPVRYGLIPTLVRTGSRIGGKQRNRGDCVQEHTRNQQNDVEHRQDDILVRGQAEHRISEQLRDMAARQHKAERLHAAKDQHNNAGTNSRINQNLRNVLPFEGLVDPLAADQAIYAGDCAGFGRREDAGINTAEDDNRHNQRPYARQERLHCFLLGHLAGVNSE